MDIGKTYGTNESKELGGVEHQIGPDAWITVARDGNTRYQAKMAKLYAAQKFVLDQKNDESEQVARAITIDTMAEHILVGWRGDISLNGVSLGAYSVEGAKQLLAVKDFRELVQRLSREASNYRDAVEKAEEKN